VTPFNVVGNVGQYLLHNMTVHCWHLELQQQLCWYLLHNITVQWCKLELQRQWHRVRGSTNVHVGISFSYHGKSSKLKVKHYWNLITSTVHHKVHFPALCMQCTQCKVLCKQCKVQNTSLIWHRPHHVTHSSHVIGHFLRMLCSLHFLHKTLRCLHCMR